jgi:hypothetical protein
MANSKKSAADTPEELRAKVSEINDLFRTARLNQMYYAQRLHVVKKAMNWSDGLIAVGSSSSLAGWGLWKYGQTSANSWAVLAGIATLLSVLKPVFQLRREIERYSKLHIGYCGLYYDLEQIVIDLRTTHILTAASWTAFTHQQKKNKELGLIDDSDAERKLDLLNECQQAVLTEIPKGSLWLPRLDEIANQK